MMSDALEIKNSHLYRILLLIISALVLVSFKLQAQEQQDTSWITHPDISGNEFGVYHFRKTFDLQEIPEHFNVHVSADNRYRLYVNGVSVAAGPQRSDVMHWRYDEIDLTPHLRSGSNLVAAVVWHWGEHKPVAQHSYQTGFLVRGATAGEAGIDTGATKWKVLVNDAYSALPVTREQAGGYYASPPGERLDSKHYPWGWESSGFDDDDWLDAEIVRETRDRGSYPYNAGGWQLVPRSIPLMEEHPVRFESVRRADGVKTDGMFLDNMRSLVVPANTRTSLLLDQSHLTNAYFRMETSKGSGSEVSVTYAEALKDENGIKGHRDEIEGKSISGVLDRFHIGGGKNRKYQTLWFRTYRYVELNIETGDEALEIHNVGGLYTAYPYKLNANFDSDLPWLEDMWAINWRVLRLCAWETYFDTPYYEQLQYIGDTRLQALLSLYMSGDDRLMRQALTHFDYSRIPEGITASRYPSDLGQYIPTFSLFWVDMVHDYWMHRDDRSYVRGLMPGIRGVLSWFEDRVDDTGLVGPLIFWPFADWVDHWGGGMPPGAKDGHSVLITLQYVYALQRAVELETAFGRQAEADRLRTLSDKLLEAVSDKAFDIDRGLFRDSLEEAVFSQHTNTFAILTGAVTGDERRNIMESILADTSLTQAGYYFSFYIFEALRESGLSHRYIEQLEPWQDMLALGLTTTPEKPPPSRTDSHAWAAHPNYGLLATVLGIRPAEAGFKSVEIRPSLGPLQEAEGQMPHPLGEIDVSLKRDGADGIKVRITLPDGLDGTFEWRGETIQLHSGTQKFSR
jgi:alpha-L-rhamnosidase